MRWFIRILVFFSFFAQVCSVSATEIRKVCFPDTCIQAEVVSSGKEREAGLMFRKQLEPGSGMLFVFEKEGQYSFWMKNMSFPIDIIWLDKDKKIVGFKENAPVCSESCPAYQPNTNASYVIETCAGFIQAHGIERGDQVRF